MKELVARLSGIFELHIRLEKAVRSFDLALVAAGLPITYIDFRALGCILSFGPVSLKQASDALEVPKTTVHYILGKLETKGYIDRAYAKRKGTPVFTCTDAGREAWGNAVAALLRGPYGAVLWEMSNVELRDYAERLRALWTAAGAETQNEGLERESMMLAAFAAESLLQDTDDTECMSRKKTARPRRSSFLL